jgi:hypothetical protein
MTKTEVQEVPDHVPAIAPENAVIEQEPAGVTSAQLEMIVRAATDPRVDIEKMERLMAMHDKLVERQTLGAFNEAMALAQAEMRPIATDMENKQTSSEYASYAAIDRKIRPIYSKHGFSLSFDTGEGAPENWIRVLCHVAHRGGYTRTYHVDLPADGIGPKGSAVMTKTHAAGSAYTYAQRYLAKLVFNISVGDDDDGNGVGVVYIDDDQHLQLVQLADMVGADLHAFCDYLQLPKESDDAQRRLDRLPERRFAFAKSALERKRGK